jgi:hypothetical protein
MAQKLLIQSHAGLCCADMEQKALAFWSLHFFSLQVPIRGN